MEIPYELPPPIPRIIIVDMEKKGYGDDDDIREADVVRSENNRWFTTKEKERFYLKSTAQRPTYGSCHGCFKSGPVGKKCNECEGQYDVMIYNHRIIDSENLAKMAETGQEVAKAHLKNGRRQTKNL